MLAVLLFSFLLHGYLTCAQIPVYVGEIHVQNPDYVSLYQTPDKGYDLLISSATGNPFEKNAVYRVSNIDQYLKNNLTNFTVETLSDSIFWPNELSGVPETNFGTRVVSVPSGNFAPRNQGGITLIEAAGNTSHDSHLITEEEDYWFYHRLLWLDMDRDLDKDIVTCRAHRPLFGYTKGQLLWLENPGNLSQSTPWKSHVLAEGLDVNFVYAQALKSSDGWLEGFFAAQFFNPGLRVFWYNDSGFWNETKVYHRDIDTSIGPVYDVRLADVNDDFKTDLLVTAFSADNGTVWAYEIPDDFRTGQYKRHLVASGFMSSSVHQGKGSPGSPQTLRFLTSGRNPIILSGADAGQAYILTSRSQAKDDWRYEVTSFLNAGTGNIGGIDLAPIYTYDSFDIFVPARNKHRVYIYRLTKN